MGYFRSNGTYRNYSFCKIKLKNIESAYIRQESIKAENLDEIFQLFEESEDWTYTVAWIDCLQKVKHRQKYSNERSLHLEQSYHKMARKSIEIKEKLSPTIPFYFPSFVLNSFSVRAFNFLYFNKQRQKVVKNFIDYETFSILLMRLTTGIKSMEKVVLFNIKW